MREICLPIPEITGDQSVEIDIKSSGNENVIQFKIVSFLFKQIAGQAEILEKTSHVQINNLKNIIENYDKTWELIQIFAPLNNSNYIQVLFRKKQNDYKIA
jgi:hypothetical protein